MAGLDVVVAEGAAHLEGVEVRRLGRFLHREAEFDDVEEELDQVLVLAVASLDREAEERLAVLQRKGRREGDARVLARRDDVERPLGLIEHEALRALREADAAVPRDDGRRPAAARRHAHHPPLGVRRFDRRGAGVER